MKLRGAELRKRAALRAVEKLSNNAAYRAVENLINGNLGDARRIARRVPVFDLLDAARQMIPPDDEAAEAAARYLKGKITFGQYCRKEGWDH